MPIAFAGRMADAFRGGRTRWGAAVPRGAGPPRRGWGAGRGGADRGVRVAVRARAGVGPLAVRVAEVVPC